MITKGASVVAEDLTETGSSKLGRSDYRPHEGGTLIFADPADRGVFMRTKWAGASMGGFGGHVVLNMS